MNWMEWIQSPQAWIGLATLSMLEIVLGIDNLIFISILSGKLPPEQRDKARKMGLSLALITRILLLCSLSWVMSLSNRLWDFTIMGLPLPNTGKDLVLAVGGLFLIWKSTKEIHEKVEGHQDSTSSLKAPSFASVIVQILLLDIVFSLDSVITAVGMSNQIPVMIAAVILAMLVMLLFVNQIGAFVEKYPTIKVLALAFLILIGTMLLAEGFQQHISKGYIYFAMAFSVAVEVINIRVRAKSHGSDAPYDIRDPARRDTAATGVPGRGETNVSGACRRVSAPAAGG